MKYFTCSVLYLSAVQIVLSQQELSNLCYTSKGAQGICKTQNECVASQTSTSKRELVSETCRIDTDGTPIICCVTPNDEKESTTVPEIPIDHDSNSTSGTTTSQNDGEDNIETRFFNGPRKRQYIPYKTSYKTPTSNLISHYEPILNNDINPTTYQKKQNYNNVQNINYNSFSIEPTVPKIGQYGTNYNRPTVNYYYPTVSNNQNYNQYEGQSNNGYGNQNFNYPSYQAQTTKRPNSYPGRPTDDNIVFKPTNRPNGNNNFRPTTSTRRPELETNYWPTQGTQESHPVWGEVSKSTSRPIREPKPTQSTSTYRTNRPTILVQKRISEEKCNEYAKIVTQTVSAVPLSINSQVTSVTVQDCPNEAVELIVGGKKAALGEFPHMAALGFRRGSAIEYSCGGTLISDEYILTAAHCTKSALGDPIHVRLGDLNLEKDDDGAQPQIIGVQEIIVNPRYKHPQLYHDIALIRMSRKVYFNKMLRPACLYTTHDILAEKAIATGWGSTNYGETSSDDLLKVVLNIIDNKQCQSLYGTDTKLKNGITESMMCAGELSGKRDTCQGDSGGPLQIVSPSHKCIHYVVGITSFGRSCGVPNSAGIYTRVSEYIDWIESTVWRNYK